MLWYLLYCISLKWNSQYLCGVPIHVSLLLCWVFSPIRSQHPPPGVREEFLTQLSGFYNSSGVHNKVPKTLLSFVKYFNVTSCKGFTLAFEILLQINIFVRYIYIFIIYFSFIPHESDYTSPFFSHTFLLKLRWLLDGGTGSVLKFIWICGLPGRYTTKKSSWRVIAENRSHLSVS